MNDDFNARQQAWAAEAMAYVDGKLNPERSRQLWIHEEWASMAEFKAVVDRLEQDVLIELELGRPP